jgi:hypothetical protein
MASVSFVNSYFFFIRFHWHLRNLLIFVVALVRDENFLRRLFVAKSFDVFQPNVGHVPKRVAVGHVVD